MKTVTMFDRVVKRDGSRQPFDAARITAALLKAGKAAGEYGEEVAGTLARKVVSVALATITDRDPSVEELQDIVEEVLLSSPFRKTAKAYVLYRDQHKKIRDIANGFNIDIVDQYLSRRDWKVNENSNMAYSLQGLNNYISSEISRTYWLDKLYPAAVREAHTDGDLHIHDLSALSVYCVGWDLYDLLREGFRGVAGKVEAGPARHFRTALGQVVNFFYTLQGEAAGAQAFANFDTLLAPFIHYDGLTYDEVRQALQEFLFNVNVPTRVGFQTPFTNITLDLTVPSYYADQPVIVGGEPRDRTYREFTKEMDMFNRAFLEVMVRGDARGRVFTFPIPTYNISRDFAWDNPTLSLLWEVTAKYGIPYFANYVNSDMNPDDARSMCCRLRIDNRELRKRGGGLFGASPLTGSIGVVTLNLPRLGFLAANEKDFFARLDRLMQTARQSLEIKRKALERLTDDGLYPYTQHYLRAIKERFGCYWKNHFSTIGVVGMNECCLNLLNEDIASAGGREFTLRVLDHMRRRLAGFQEESGDIYNLEATPAEATSYRLAALDRERYPDARGAGTGGGSGAGRVPFYTNSTQLPVDHTDDVFEVLDLQDEIQSRYTGGTVQHLFFGERLPDPEALKGFLKTVFSRYRLPYLSVTPTFSVCPSCGYLDGEQPHCPSCGSGCEVYSRVVGYLRPVGQWNRGKQDEFAARRTLRL